MWFFSESRASRSEPVGPSVMPRIGKSRGFIFLHDATRQLPWNDILAEKHRGEGGGSTETLTFSRNRKLRWD
jgi:hypothetical protein